MMPDVTILTSEEMTRLKKELDHRVNKVREEIASELEKVRAEGDISENSWHDAVIEKRDLNERKIADLREKLRNAKVAKKGKDDGKVKIGSKLDLEITTSEQSNSVNKKMLIVSATEANPLLNKISVESPLGRALKGRKEGEKIEFNQPNGTTVIYNIIKVSN